MHQELLPQSFQFLNVILDKNETFLRYDFIRHYGVASDESFPQIQKALFVVCNIDKLIQSLHWY
jgi:hypothetical protein